MSRNQAILLVASLICAAACINIPLCSSGGVYVQFKNTQDVADATTRATLCHDRKNLFVSW